MLVAAAFAVLVAFAIAAGPPIVCALVFRTTWHLQAYRAWSISMLVLVFCAQLILCGALGMTAAAWVAACGFTLALALHGRAASKARRLQLACEGLLQPSLREASLEYVERELSARKAKGEQSAAHYAGYARTAMVLAGAIDASGLSATAIGVLNAIDASRLGPLLGAKRAQNLAAFQMRSGARDAARKTLAQVTRPVPDAAYEDALAALDALLLSLDGDAKDAEARSRAALAASRHPNVLASWQAALAHALAAQGLRDEASSVLREMRASHGVVALERVARHEGAASSLARALQAETGAPYR